MAVFNNLNKASPITSVECSPVSDGNFTFFYLDAQEHKEGVKKWLTSREVGQEIIAETVVHGRPALVTKGGKTQDEIKSLLEARGEKLVLHTIKKPVNLWALRGTMSLLGQSLQLGSALIQVEKVTPQHPRLNSSDPHYSPKLKEGMWIRKGFSADIGMFAILNLIANGANIMYGAQHEKDENRLADIKDQVNESLAPHLANGDKPFDLNEKRSALRKDPAPPPTTMDKFDAFARKNSVRFFEIGLRFIGSLALVFPSNKWKSGISLLSKGRVSEAFRNSLNESEITRNAGVLYLTGKAISFLTKVHDPYDPKPHTTLDTIREKLLFKLGTATEFLAGSLISYGAFTTKNIGLYNKNATSITPYRDWLGTVGGGLFAVGYVMRFNADFGTKNINMEEVYAHAEDMLAKTPPEKLPQLLADTAAELTSHFKDKNMNFGEAYTHIITDMYRFNHIAINKGNPASTPKDGVIDDVKEIITATQNNNSSENITNHADQLGKRAKNPYPKNLSGRVAAPLGSYSEDIAHAAETKQSQGFIGV